MAWVSEESRSWILPLRHERITSFETALTKASFQLKQICCQLKVRPLAIFDRHYGNGRFLQLTAEIETDLLIRLASNRCIYGRPEAYSGSGTPRKHGQKFKLNDPQTYPEPREVVEVEDSKLGDVRVTLWSQLHFRNCTTKEVEVIRVEVLKPKEQRRKFKSLWLFWTGQTRPMLSQIWHQYLRRFSLEHWYRFAKQRLFWTKPKLSDHQVCERWSDLIMIMSWQLWFARSECIDSPLAWQSTQTNLAPGRVAQAFPTIIAVIGTMANLPKTRGKSPGQKKRSISSSSFSLPNDQKAGFKATKIQVRRKSSSLTSLKINISQN